MMLEGGGLRGRRERKCRKNLEKGKAKEVKKEGSEGESA